VDRSSFVDAARTALDLALASEVRAAWDRESACAGMSVGGLTHHLLQQVVNSVRLLEAAPVEEQPIPLLEHYARAAWVRAGPDDDANVTIREEPDAEAANGADHVLAVAEGALAQLPALLAAPRSPDLVRIPWQGWSLATDDFQVTREMELVVHADDLAASVDLPTPEFPDDVVAAVLALLSAVAVRRHGQAAVVRALSRPQRAPDSVSAF
jgi:hypothetical protein